MSEQSPRFGFLTLLNFKDEPIPFDPLWSLFSRANRVAHGVLRLIKIDSQNPQVLFAACLYLRLLDAVQSSAILARLGMRHDSATALRTAFEAMVYLRNAVKDHRFPSVYTQKGADETLKRIRMALPGKTRNGLPNDLRERLETAEAKLKEEVGLDQNEKDSASIQQLSVRVGLGGLYETIYRMLSASAHIESGTLVDYIQRRNGEFESLVYEPRYEYSPVYLWSAADFLLDGVQSITTLLGIPTPEEAPGIREALNQAPSPWPSE